MSTAGDRGFADRWRDLAVDDTANLAIDATITPETLAARTPTKTAPGTPPLDALPRVSLAWSSEGPAGDVSEGTASDITLGEPLGAGGMGQVHVAHQRSLGREVAVKLLNPGADAAMARSLVSEAVLAGFLAHPGIVPVHSLGVDDRGRPVLVMKRIEGAPWRDLIHDDDHPAWPQWESRAGDRLLAHLEILSQVCDAVHFAHSRGVIHRDIKPENVMLGSFGEVYLVDWGVAVRVESQVLGTLVGTPAFMAPEMVAGTEVDARTDVYLLGATLHEVLTRTHRHAGDNLREVLGAAYASAPRRYPETIPTQLAALCNAATAAAPEDRPASALEFRAAIADYLRHRSSITLSAAARARLDELLSVLAEDASEERNLRASELVAEARFGFSQALDEWDDNEQARSGLADCLVAQVEILLIRGQAAAARTLVDRIEEPPEQLEQRVRELEAAVAAERQERERLRALERDMDGAVGTRPRRTMFMFMLALAVVITTLIYLQDGGVSAISHATAFAVSIGVLVAMTAGVIIKRDALLANAFNRRSAGLVAVLVTVIPVNRGLAWAVDAPLQYMFAIDALLAAAIACAGAVTLMRWCLWLVAILVATAVVITAVPSVHPASTFSAGALASLVTALGFWRRTR